MRCRWFQADFASRNIQDIHDALCNNPASATGAVCFRLKLLNSGLNSRENIKR